ncbi:carboxypeptidase-like regulatory domain-containing protein [Hymenobacter sp. BT175]|uniref:carboxypeptidase-like regulatory domain-containing protein n=1 Tax=Hymenobacter translucens TaxID=2886507 RepID=UPI001D0EDB24|nr:carboxypeptidase-like regulatory domain-containing protein [Hymenobacter translucens]MCC2547654.1 carboxypeptidase-like regulatory domain-containing protein [Hymenobacter translucens]
MNLAFPFLPGTPTAWASRAPWLVFLLGIVLLLSSSKAVAQNTIRVTGSVSEAATRKPIPGASVVVQRTRRGVPASNEGDFSLDVTNTDTLLFRAVGFKPQRYILGGTGLSQIVVQIKLVRDSVMLGEVRVQEGRPDRAEINRALRNIKRPAPKPNAVKRAPAPKPLFAVDSTAPKAPTPTMESPVSLIYEQLSREGKERRKMAEIQAQEKEKARLEALRKAKTKYNRNFKDNRGYEVE